MTIHLSAVTIFAFLVLAAGSTPEEIREAAESVLEDGNYQRELPGEAPPPEMPGWLEKLLSGIGRFLGSGVAEVLFWALVAVVLAVLISWLAREWQRRRRPDRETVDPGVVLPPDIAGPIPDPDVLAKEGRYAEAIHAMLLLSIRELALRRPRELPPALTSREILRDSRLEVEPAQELRGLVLAVEVSRFGGAPVERGDFALVSERYRKFLSLVTGAAA